MRRFYAPHASPDSTEIILEGDEARHAIQVLRLIRGDRLVILNGKGDEFVCECIDTDKKILRARVLEKSHREKPVSEITLIQAIPKGKLIEDIIEKAIELGVSRIIPITTRRTIPDIDEREINKRKHRWEQIAISAIKQCGQVYLPLIDNLTDFSSIVTSGKQFEMSFVCALTGNRRHPRFFFEEFRNKFNRNPKSVAVWIGPEGDFTDEEVQQIISNGAKPITLGSLVLRVETAAIYALAILNYELQWKGLQDDEGH